MGRDVSRTVSVAAAASRFQLPLVFVVMAVQAQQFPVASIRRVVVVIVISVMDCQFAKVGASEFARAATTDPWIDLERLFPVALFALRSSTTSVRHDAVQLVRVRRTHAVISFEGSTQDARGAYGASSSDALPASERLLART